MKRKILIVSFALVALVLVLSGCSLKNTSKTAQTSEISQPKVINLTGEEEKSVYDLLKAKYQVEASDSSFGVMVKSVNGLSSTDKEFWLYSVNDKSAEVAADKYITHAGDRIVWELKSM